MCKSTHFKKIPLRYLCGALYMNFQLLWDPTINIIVTHAQGLDISDFWSIFVEELKNVVENIKNPTGFQDDHSNIDVTFLENLFAKTYEITVKPDFVNYRLLLWKAMTYFPEIAETKTRDVSELMLKFME